MNVELVTKKEQQWQILKDKAESEEDLFRKGMVWVRRNRSDKAAGAAICRLLRLKQTDTLIVIGKKWVRDFPDEKFTPALVGLLLPLSPSQALIKMAEKFLRSKLSIDLIDEIVRAVCNNPTFYYLLELIVKKLQKDPKNKAWLYSFLFVPEKKNEAAQEIVAMWIYLNRKNPNLFPLPFMPLATSPYLVTATFYWLCEAGTVSPHFTMVLLFTMKAAQKLKPSELPGLITFARGWFRHNSEHKDVGLILGVTLYLSKSSTDYKRAKEWYLRNTTNSRGWAVLSYMLELSTDTGKHDRFAIEEAKKLLAKQKPSNRSGNLIYNLLKAAPDKTVARWAKNAVKSSMHMSMLVCLLKHAPDVESIALAEEFVDGWKNTEFEPEILFALLSADKTNKFARRRARLWLKQTSKNKHRKTIEKLYSSV